MAEIWKVVPRKAVRFSALSLNGSRNQPYLGQPHCKQWYLPCLQQGLYVNSTVIITVLRNDQGLASGTPFWTIVAFLASVHLKQVIIYSYINSSHCSPQATELQLQLMHTGLSKSYTLSLAHGFYEGLKLMGNPTNSPVTYF